MATLALPQPSASNGSPIQTESWTAEPQGAEDKQLRNNAQSAVAHWKSRAEYLLGADTTAEDHASGEDYVSVPFEFVKEIVVTYEYVGVLQPMPYPLEEYE
jgi:hypothetical protein